MSMQTELQNKWQQVMARDARQDGRFVFAVRTTGVYCRPSCPSRRPRRESVEFFSNPNDAERAGYRDAAGPTVHFPIAPGERDPWAPEVSETHTAFAKAVGENRLDRALLG